MPQQIVTITAPAVPLLIDDVDTDRIIPARFLRCVTFDGLGEHAFEDDKLQDPQHPFNQAVFRQAKILIAGRNFGCGSSREHAPQALGRWGIQAIVAESFAEIFFGNCTSLGIPCVQASRADLDKLGQIVAADPALPMKLDLLALTVQAGELVVPVTMPAGPRGSLMTGEWDFLGQLLDGAAQVQQRVHQLPYLTGFPA